MAMFKKKGPDEGAYKLFFYRQAMKKEFPGVKLKQMLMAVAIFIQPEPAWEGLTIYEIEPPQLGPRLGAIAARGPGAAVFIEKLANNFEKRKVSVWDIEPGEAEPVQDLLTVKDGKWVECPE